jgi:hypothetical protein
MIRLAAIVCLAFVACASTPKNPEAWMEREINACLPTAIAFREGLRKYNVWAEVLVARWWDGTQPRGHAYTAYLYPPGRNQLWTYDSWGSIRSRAFKNDPLAVARTANVQRNQSTQQLTAEYLR